MYYVLIALRWCENKRTVCVHDVSKVPFCSLLPSNLSSLNVLLKQLVCTSGQKAQKLNELKSKPLAGDLN